MQQRARRRERHSEQAPSESDVSPVHVSGPDPRASWRIFPKWFRHFLAAVSGRPNADDPLPPISPYRYLGFAIAQFVGSVLITATLVVVEMMILQSGQPSFEHIAQLGINGLGWIIAVAYQGGRARNLQVNCGHHAMHASYSGDPARDWIIGHVISLALMLQDFIKYCKDHLEHHDPAHLTTQRDADLRFLARFGIAPGVTKKLLWRRLFGLCFGLTFHVAFFKARFVDNFLAADTALVRRIAAIAWQGSLLIAAIATSVVLKTATPLAVWVGAWLIPLTWSLQTSALLQFASEHQWWGTYRHWVVRPYRQVLVKLTPGRFMGDPVPALKVKGVNCLKLWLLWWVRLLFVHIPSRMFVLVGDLPAHDWHHRHARHRGWPNAIYHREREIARGATDYYETWSLREALDVSFQALSELPAVTVDTLGDEEIAEIFRAM